MYAAKVALPPKCEAPRKTWPGPRGTTNYVNNNTDEDSPLNGAAQYPVIVPRIIATHWLRSEAEETRHG